MQRFLRIPFAAAFMALFLAGCASVDRPETPGTLKVLVNVPPTWGVFLEDDVATAFVSRIRDVFQRSGFDRPVEEIRPVEDPSRQPYLLTINLTEWRISRIGNIECTFSAELKTPRGTKSFGLYTNTEMRWGRSGRWGLARAFENAAEGAIHDLYSAIAKSELLAGNAKIRGPVASGRIPAKISG